MSLARKPTGQNDEGLSEGLRARPARTTQIADDHGKPRDLIRSRARLTAWLALVIGVVGSVAANVAHAQPALGARIAAAFPPLALLLCVEIMTRLDVPPSWRWRLTRWLGTGVVAAVAAMASYVHQAALFRSFGEPMLIAGALPIAVDGLMLVASVTLLANSRQGELQDQQAWVREGSRTVPFPRAAPDLVPLIESDATNSSPNGEKLTSSRVLPKTLEPTTEEPIGSRTSIQAKREDAQRLARDWLTEGRKADPKELGELFGMSRSWGRDQLRRAREGALIGS